VIVVGSPRYKVAAAGVVLTTIGVTVIAAAPLRVGSATLVAVSV
jgi:hypothetical protein